LKGVLWQGWGKKERESEFQGHRKDKGKKGNKKYEGGGKEGNS